MSARAQGGTRRGFMQLAAALGCLPPARRAAAGPAPPDPGAAPSRAVSMVLCGDVMLGRGIDQILPHPGDPELYEQYVSSARTYVALAETAHGTIPRAVGYDYVWGDALDTLQRLEPAVRIINLETSVTDSAAAVPKGINYKMNPANIRVLTVAGIDCCVLANNHVLDWGYPGLLETLATLEQAGMRTAVAGRSATAAAAPAVLPTRGDARVLVFAFAARSSGVPRSWAAQGDQAGVNLLPDPSERTVASIAARAQAARRPGDLLVASIHWGGNWGYEIPAEQTSFAHGLIDRAGFDVVHGHSSHHAKAIEIYRDRPILYGCGDFLNDYEGITGKEEYRDDLAVMYLPRLATPHGSLIELALELFRISRFRLRRASGEDTAWLQATLDRESRRFGTRVELREGNRLAVVW